MYPALIRIKYIAMKSKPNEKSQYSRHGNKLHSDYLVDFTNRPAQQRPISVIVSLDAFNFIYLPTKMSSRKELIYTVVSPGQMVFFTNDCLHSGGANNTHNTVFRLFAYMASQSSDIPINGVCKYMWSDTSDDAVILDAWTNLKRKSHNEPQQLKSQKKDELLYYTTFKETRRNERHIARDGRNAGLMNNSVI